MCFAPRYRKQIRERYRSLFQPIACRKLCSLLVCYRCSNGNVPSKKPACLVLIVTFRTRVSNICCHSSKYMSWSSIMIFGRLSLLGLLCFIAAGCSAKPLKVLGLFPFASFSHFLFFKPVLRDLANKGHEVTVVGYFPWKDAPTNYHDIVIPGDLVGGSVDLQVCVLVSNRERYYHSDNLIISCIRFSALRLNNLQCTCM